MSLLKVEDLNVRFVAGKNAINKETVHAVRGMSLEVRQGECLAIVGESGCGKSAMLSSLLMLDEGSEMEGRISFKNHELHKLGESELRPLRGREIAMIFQDPMSALNPTMTIGDQISEALPGEKYQGKKAKKERCLQLLEEVRIADAHLRLKQYPFEFSGGMLQRVAIALALAGEPCLILADEPTTALDVTIQKQILTLLKKLQESRGVSLVLVSHDLAVVSEMAERVIVMYAGSKIEEASVRDIFTNAKHPYTKALLEALPAMSKDAFQKGLKAVQGQAPDLSQAINNCAFCRRCDRAMQICASEKPPVVSMENHEVSCWLHHRAYKELVPEVEDA